MRLSSLRSEMENPTIVVITDRNDLDDQLFDTFAASNNYLDKNRYKQKAENILKELLKVASGGIVFTTIQKFLPETEDQIMISFQTEEILLLLQMKLTEHNTDLKHH